LCIGLLGRLYLRSDDGKLVYHCWALQESDAKEKCQQVAAYCGGVWRTSSFFFGYEYLMWQREMGAKSRLCCERQDQRKVFWSTHSFWAIQPAFR
jgi:hypothetical protein